MNIGVGRRTFLAGSGALVSVAAGLNKLQAAQQKGALPINIIWMVADGMSAGVLPLAEQFSIRARGTGTIWQSLHSLPGAAHALMDMASLDSLVTDSSSAASAWGSGSRIFNAWVNMLPDGTRLVPIAELARDKGKRIGLVTTATVTHATPAGFVAVSRRRDDEESIAVQYLRICDVVLGGGSKFFDAKTRADKRDLIAAFRAAGFATVDSKSGLHQAKNQRLLGLFSQSHMPYALDVRNENRLRERVPTLAEMTQAALDRLAGSSKGFLLQVEGGRVDHAAHNNDAAALLWDQLTFDDAIGVVLRFAEGHSNTLVVVTADHGNANPGLNGTGAEYRGSNTSFERLLAARSSFAMVTPQLGMTSEYSMQADSANTATANPRAQQVRDVAKEAFGIDLSAGDAGWICATAAGRKGVAISKQYDKLVGVLGQVLSNHTGIGWTGTSHTSDYTILTAVGPGSERFQGFLRNTEVFQKLCALMEISHRNPAMKPERARQFLASAAVTSGRIHWA
jgi:alkaline phosphatase